MLGIILLYSGFGAFIAAFVLCFFMNIMHRSNLQFLHTLALRVGFILLSLTFLLLIYYFISDNFSVYYVWLYSSKDMPLYYKIAAVWAGQQGTFLLWTWISSISLLWLLTKKEQIAESTLLITESLVVFLLVLTISSEPFKLMSQFPHLAGMVVNDGAGLDPELLSPWMVLHPPITFIAYAAMTVPFAAAAAYFFLGKGNWMPLSQSWAQFSWLFFSLGVGLIGGIWTYEAGWNIWTWDASEAGSLIPWLLLTAGLHQHKNQNKKAALFMLTFISILFVTFIIRSGFWGSVHEFTETSVSRVLEAALILITGAAIWLIYRNKNKFDIKASVDTLTLGVMVLLGFIVFIGLSLQLWMKIFGEQASVGAEFYNLTCYPFVLLLLILLGACMFDEPSEKKITIFGSLKLGKRSTALGIIAGISSIALAFIRPSEAYWLANPASTFYLQSSALTRAYGSLSLLSMIPPVVFTLAAILRRMRRRLNGISLIHLGAALLFFGGVFTTSFDSEYTLIFAADEIGKTKSIGDYDVKLSKFHVEQNQRDNWVQRVTIEVRKNGQILGDTTARYLRDKTGNYATSGIIRGHDNDIYVIFSGLELTPDKPPVIPLHIKIFPMINIFWLGDILLSIGIILLIIKKK